MIPGLPNPYVLLAAGVIFIAAVAGAGIKGHNIGVERTDAKWLAKEIVRQQAVQKAVNEATQQYIDNEAANGETRRKLEGKIDELEKDRAGLRLANGRLVDAHCGMFDRNGRPVGERGADAGAPATGAALTAQGRPTICDFPEAVRAALQQFGRELSAVLDEADAAAIIAIAGHEYGAVIDRFRAEHQPKLGETNGN